MVSAVPFGIRYGATKDHPGTALEDLPVLMGKWSMSMRFLEAKTAFEWKIPLNEFRALSRDDRGEMMAYLMARDEMAAYDGRPIGRKTRD